MAKTDKMTREQIQKAKANASAELKELEKAEAAYDKRRLKELRAEIETLLAKEGFSLTQLLDGKPIKKAAKSTAVAKYRHPENKSLTWSGRGRQPVWFKEYVETGGKPESLLIT